MRMGIARGPLKTLGVLAAAVSVSLALGACGGSDDGSAEAGGTATAGEQSLTTVKAMAIPIADFAPLWAGLEQGFFEEQGIDLQISTTFDGTVIVPALMSDQAQLGTPSTGPMANAIAQGLPVVAIAPSDNMGVTKQDDYSHLVTLKNSGLDSVDKLEGKTIAVVNLKNIADMAIRATLQNNGVDPSTVKIIAMPWPEMASALKSGSVDAAAISEPFLTAAREELELNDLAGVHVETMPNLPLGLYVVSREYYDENPETVRGLQLAFAKSLEYARDNPEAIRELITSYTDIEPALAERITLPQFTTEMDVEGIQRVADLMLEFGFLQEKLDMSKALAPFPPSDAGDGTEPTTEEEQ